MIALNRILEEVVQDALGLKGTIQPLCLSLDQGDDELVCFDRRPTKMIVQEPEKSSYKKNSYIFCFAFERGEGTHSRIPSKSGTPHTNFSVELSTVGCRYASATAGLGHPSSIHILSFFLRY